MAEKLTLFSPSARLGTAVLFRARDEAFTVDDAVAAAAFRGDLDRPIEETFALIAAERRADDEENEVEDEAAQTASEEFRYAHDLISAAETDAWLEARGMNADDLGAWIYQRLCPPAAAADIDEIPDDFPDLLRVHLWLSDAMPELERRLRRRVAAAVELNDASISNTDVMRRFLDARHFDDAAVAEWLIALERDRSWLERIATMEAAYEMLVRHAASAEARSRKLAATQMSHARIEVERLMVESENAAREALLCVKQDGLTLADVARESGYRSDRLQLWSGELDSAIASRLLGASEGSVVGPIEDGGFAVLQVLRKIAPSLSDPAVVARIDRGLLDDYFDELCSRHTE